MFGRTFYYTLYFLLHLGYNTGKHLGIPQLKISDFDYHNQGVNDCKPGHMPVSGQQLEEKIVKTT